MESNNPLLPIADEMLGAIDAGFYFLPVVLAAAIPDICAALESDDGRSTKDRYRAWFDTWLASQMTFITSDDCYSFRCGVVHQGRMGDLKNNVARVLFPLPVGPSMTNCRINDAYVYGVAEFCRDMINASSRWFDANRDNSNVIKNAAFMMRVYPDGLKPYIEGLPLLA